LMWHRRCTGTLHQTQKNRGWRFNGTVRRLSPVFLKHQDASPKPYL
jgi:hypothetical protein